MSAPIFITGIGTDVGKTIVSAIMCEATGFDYWKPIQAGLPSDASLVKTLISNPDCKIHDEKYILNFPASPHISASRENINISIDDIVKATPKVTGNLIIEGAGGVYVPLNENEFILDLIKAINGRVIIVSKNYLGSINHSLLTFDSLKQKNIDIIGWVFNEEYLSYENDILKWTNLPRLMSVKKLEKIDKTTIQREALSNKDSIIKYL